MSFAELPSEFEELDASSVFKQVGRRLSSEKGRSLWNRMQSEMQSGGVHRAASYLESTLNQRIEQTKEALKRFKEVSEK